MKRTRKWLAVLLAAVLLLGALPMTALAEEDPWSGAAEVEDFDAFKAALEDAAVERIKITGDVTVTEGTAAEPLEAGKPILVGESGRLSLAPGAVMSSDVPQGQFSYEDRENTWYLIAEGMAAFLLWNDGTDCYRELYGSMPENLDTLMSGYGVLSVAVLSGDAVLNCTAEAESVYVLNGSLTLGPDADLTVSYYLGIGDGDLTIEDGGVLELTGEDGGWVQGDVYLLGAAPSVPSRLKWGGEGYYTHLTVCWGGEDYGEFISMTPYDECEVTFALMEERDGAWSYRPVTPQVQAPLVYGENENHEGRMTLTARDAAWNERYELTYAEGGETYGLYVYVELPQVGCYSAPAPSEDAYLADFSYNPLSDTNVFYFCVGPYAWFKGDENWEMTGSLIYTGDSGEEYVKWEPAGTGVWKITVTGCEFYAAFAVELRENGQVVQDVDRLPQSGVWIDPVNRLTYSTKEFAAGPADSAESGDRVLREEMKSELHDTLTLRAKSSADVVLYLLVYNGDTAQWICEQTNADWVRGDGVSIAPAPEKAPYVRVTAGSSAGDAAIIRLEGQEVDNGEYEPIENSTRGIPLNVRVTSASSGGSSSSSGSSKPGTIVPNTGGAGHSAGTTASASLAVSVKGTQNGSVSASARTAVKGGTVTLTVKPNSGYELESLTVTDANGREVDVARKDETTYTFTMPETQVTVSAAFRSASAPARESEPESTEAAPSLFPDVAATAYYYDAVKWAVENGVTSGTASGGFSPDAGCTRGQVVTFLWRAAGQPAPKSADNPFTDVKPTDYNYQAVLWAYENGITGGSTANTFAPNGVCTRAQIVTFLWRAKGKPAASGSNSFSDVPGGTYYSDAVNWAVSQGVTGGTNGGSTFSPNAACSRAQVVTFLFRAQ